MLFLFLYRSSTSNNLPRFFLSVSDLLFQIFYRLNFKSFDGGNYCLNLTDLIIIYLPSKLWATSSRSSENQRELKSQPDSHALAVDDQKKRAYIAVH